MTETRDHGARGFRRTRGPDEYGWVEEVYETDEGGWVRSERTRRNVRPGYRKMRRTTYRCATCGHSDTRGKVIRHVQEACGTRAAVTVAMFRGAARRRVTESRWSASSRVSGWGTWYPGYTIEVEGDGVRIGYRGGERTTEEQDAAARQRTFERVRAVAMDRGWSVTEDGESLIVRAG